MSVTRDYYCVGAIKKRYPEYAMRIDQGDFKVFLNRGGCVVIEWTNTSIFGPTYSEMMRLVNTEFTRKERKTLLFVAGLVSLSLVSKVPRDLVRF